MAQELRDLRAKVSVETDCVLEAYCRFTGKDRSELAREVMHNWAVAEIDKLRLLQLRLEAEGMGAASKGGSGRGGEV